MQDQDQDQRPKEIRSLNLEDIAPNNWNPHGMTDAEFSLLRESVREKGQFRPIVVIEMDVGDEFDPAPSAPYRIIDGQHLHKALVAEHLEHHGTGLATVLVYGKNSEVGQDIQMEIGQTINHGMRGTLEDAHKTGKIVEILSRTRSLDDISRRTGQSTTYLESTRRIVSDTPRRSSPIVTTERTGGDRKGQTVPLVFEDTATLARYNTAVKKWETHVDPENTLTPGRRRIRAVLAALEGLDES